MVRADLSFLSLVAVLFLSGVVCHTTIDLGPHQLAPADGDAPSKSSSACAGLHSGFYCGNDGLNGYLGAASDLVWCWQGAVGAVTPCPQGCIATPLSPPSPVGGGRADTCNECPAAEGWHCATDFFNPIGNHADGTESLADLVVRCVGGELPDGGFRWCGSNGLQCMPRDGEPQCCNDAGDCQLPLVWPSP
jgi:hypothetical protein